MKKGDRWYYKRDDKGDSWQNNGFLTDPAWTEGATPIGYGYTDPALGTDITKGDGSMNVYMQKTFTLDSITNVKSLLINIDADDAAKIYLNGKQIYNKVTDSDVNKDVTDIYPDNPKGGSSGDVWVKPDGLKAGENILSVDVANATKTSSDLYFNMDFGVSSKAPTASGNNAFYEKLILTPGENQSKLNFAWYTSADSQIVDYYVNAAYNDPAYCVQKGADGGGFYFNDANAKTVYKIPLDKQNPVKPLLAVDVAANYTIELSENGSDYRQVAAAPGGAGVADMGKGNRTVAEFKLDEYLPNAETCWVRIGDQTPANGWGGCVYNVKVSYTDEDGDGVGELLKGVADARVQLVKKSALLNGEMPEPTSQNTFTGLTSDAVSGSASNKVTATVEPDTEYAYRIGRISTDEWSDTYYTDTESGGSAFDFIFVGDAQLGASGNLAADGQRWNDAMNIAEKNVPDAAFIVSAGDQVNTGSNEGEYKALTSAKQLQSTPFVPTIGNHDANDKNWTYHYNVPNSTDYGKTGAGSDYYYFYGETMFVVLNGNNTNAAEHKKAIDEANTAYKTENGAEPRWKIAVMHQDIYGSGKQHSMKQSMVNFRKSLSPVFDEYDFDVVLTGHDHTYTRSYIMKGNEAQKDSFTGKNGQYVNPDGTLYITANSSSGSKYYPLCPVRGTYVNVRNQFEEPSYSAVSISENEFTIKTYRSYIDSATKQEKNELYDECTIAKDATADDLSALVTEAEKVSPASDELTSALTLSKFLLAQPNPKASQITAAFEALSEAMPYEKINDGADITSFKIGDREADITEVTTYGDKQADGSYVYDNEVLNLEDTVPVTGTVKIKVPYDTDLKTAKADITVSEGASYSLNREGFAGTVICTVTSQRGNLEHEYTISVTKEAAKNGFVTGEDGVERYYKNGVLLQNCEISDKGTLYWLTDGGVKLKGAFAENGGYYGDNGARVFAGFVKANSNLYYITAAGVKQTGFFNIGSNAYYADVNGAVFTGGKLALNGAQYYFDSNGAMAKNKFVAVGKLKCYYGADGKLKSNCVVAYGGKKYFVGANGAPAKNAWGGAGKTVYRTDSNGVIITSAVKKIGGKTYLFAASGVMQRGNKIVSFGGAKYYVDKKGYVKKKAVVKYKGKKYYVGANGRAVKKKLVTYKGKKYYFNAKCVMVKNKTVKVKGKKYKFDKNGVGRYA